MAIPIGEDPYSATIIRVTKDEVDNPPVQFYRPKSLSTICELTKFSRREIQIIYRSFKQGCPNGIVTLSKFQEILSQIFPRGNPKRYAEYVFKTFDRDCNEQINFEEFVTGLSIITRGSIDEKIDWIFRLYDVNKRGIIGQPELLMVTQSIYELLGKNVEPPISRRSIIDHVLDVHRKMCRNGQSYIDREEFIRMCKADEQLCDSLVLFDTIL
uniref:EF-hand domain-containing protein n=1 Tax=Panagrolaimus sp. JU765 TaxID=591449 RepID=A0AC34PUU8_9BILA